MRSRTATIIFFIITTLLTAAWVASPLLGQQFGQCIGEGTITAPPRFGRLMHDSQWMDWPSRMADPNWPAGFSLNWYPETVKFWTDPLGGDGAIPYNKEWLEYLRELQPNEYSAIWITTVSAGLFNKKNQSIPISDLSKLKTVPVAESISSGGNVVRFLEFDNGSGRMDMFDIHRSPPEGGEINYQTRPWLVTKFTSVSRQGGLGNAGGVDVYFPNVSKQATGYWVDLNRVELFPILPYCAVVKEALAVHSSPAIFASAIGMASVGQAVTVREYLPQGSTVWGRTDEGWILLEYLNDGFPIFPTTWEMKTRPPILY